MSSTQGLDNSSKPSFLRRAVAALVLIVAGLLLLKIVIGFVIGIFWVLVAVVAVGAVLWAVATLL
jgi:hypothetical protein